MAIKKSHKNKKLQKCPQNLKRNSKHIKGFIINNFLKINKNISHALPGAMRK
jgi:hypothetical protein